MRKKPKKGPGTPRSRSPRCSRTRARPKRVTQPCVTYSDEVAARLCNLLASERKSLTTILDENSGLPSRRAVYKWLEENERFAIAFGRARREQAHSLFDLILELLEELDEVRTHEEVAAVRTKIDTLKWATGKLFPKVYGDRLALAGDEEAPLQFAKAREDLGAKLEALGAQLAGERVAEARGHLAGCAWADDRTWSCAPGCPVLELLEAEARGTQSCVTENADGTQTA